MKTITLIKTLMSETSSIDSANLAINGTEGQAGLLDGLLIAAQEHGAIHEFWNDIYAEMQWSFKEYDHDENKMVAVEGNKAPSKIATYKSQSIKANKLNGKTLEGIASWTDLKALIKPVDSDFKVRQDAAWKLIKEALKEAEKKGNGSLLEELEGIANSL
jgi:hypothetical protein